MAATGDPRVVMSPSPASAPPSYSKLNAPGTNAQNAASIITIAGGDVLIRDPSIANGTTRNAPTAPEWVGDRNKPPTFCPTSATPTAAINHSSDPLGAER